MPPSLKVAILEIDGAELEYQTEMDLGVALTHIGYSPTGVAFDEDKIISNHTGDVMTNSAGNVMRRS
jgi:hypothetical protein